MIAHVFGDSNMWGDEQPGCSIDENATEPNVDPRP